MLSSDGVSITLSGRIFEDVTGDGVTAGDPGVAGWVFSSAFTWHDLALIGRESDGRPICQVGGEQTQQVSAVSGNSGLIVASVQVMDPTPGECGLYESWLTDGAAFGLTAIHDMQETPGWRQYTQPPGSNVIETPPGYFDGRLSVRLTTANVSPPDLNSTVRVYRENSISGVVFEDWDADGQQDPSEPGISGVSITRGFNVLPQQSHDDVLTDSQGRFTNANIEPGVASAHNGPTETTTRLQTSQVGFKILSGQTLSDFQVGFFTKPTVRGTVFHDNDGDGTRDADDPIYRGTVILEDPNGATRSMLTNSQGEYSFDSLGPGVHSLSLRADDIEGRFLTQPVEQVICNGNESRLPFHSLSQSAFGFDGDFGVYLGQRLHGRKFDDRNGNGQFDDGVDQPIMNAQIEIDVCGDDANEFHADIVATTKEGGFFSSDYVGSGRHLVRQAIQITESATVPVNPGYYEVTVGADQPSPSFLPFGVTRQLVSGFVFDDLNADGVWQEETEPPAAGVTVQLSKNGGNSLPRTGTTNALGQYEIGHDGPGTYGVSMILPLEYLQTTPLSPAVQQIAVANRGENIIVKPFGRGSLVVNHAGDQADADVSDNVCDFDVQQAGPQCTLRAAIQFSNAKTGLQKITFHLPSISGSTIQPLSSLPEITDPVEIDGGEAHVTLLGGNGGNGLTLSAGQSTIRRLTIAGFSQAGLELTTKGDNVIEETELIGNGAQGLLIREESTLNTIRKNRIGTDRNDADRGNQRAGIEIHSEGNIVGGDEEDDGNQIAYNAVGVEVHFGFNRVQNNVIVSNREQGLLLIDGNNRVQGNYIGMDRQGKAMGNAGAGIQIDSDKNTIGGGEARQGNVIAHNQRGIDASLMDENTIDNNEVIGNLAEGIVLRDGSDKNIVRRNYVGIDRAGAALGNGSVGIWVASSNNMIGGLDDDAGNIVAFNGADETVVAKNPQAGYGIVVAPLPDTTATLSGNAILRNNVRQNAGPGIDLGLDGSTPSDHGSSTPLLDPDADAGPNGLQNAPELVALVFENQTVGRLFSTPDERFRLEFFANAADDVHSTSEGAHFLGTIDVTTDAAGLVTFNVPDYSLSREQVMTATASRYLDTAGGLETSEFSARPIRDDDTCGNTELQQIKDAQWQVIQQRIEQIATVDAEGAQHLRTFVQRTGRRQPDGCIPVSPQRLDSLLEVTVDYWQTVKDDGWWVDFAELLESDADRLDQLSKSVEVELGKLLTDESYFRAQVRAFEDAMGNALMGLRDEIGYLRTDLEREGPRILFDALVLFGNDVQRVETYTKLVSDALAFELFAKVFDPDVPVEQRIGLYLVASIQFVGALDGGAAVGKGLIETTRLKALVNRLSKSVAGDSELSDVLATAMRKHTDYIIAREKVYLKDLLDGEEVPIEIMDQLGWTPGQIDALRRIAIDEGVRMQFRTTNPHSAKWIRSGRAGTKPVDIKAKTINDLDVYLGYRSQDKGLVGLLKKESLIDPTRTPPCIQNLEPLCGKIKARHQKHVDDYDELFSKLDQNKYRIEADGRIVERATNQQIAGDIDPVAFLDADGNHISGPAYEALVQRLRTSNALIQHGAETNIIDDVIKALKKACELTPPSPKCLPEGSDGWIKEVSLAIDLKRTQLEPAHINGHEITVEFAPDARIRRRTITSLPDVFGEGEEPAFEPVPKEQAIRLFADMDIDIRRDHLTTFDSIFAEIKERNDVKFELLTRRLDAAFPDIGIDVADFHVTSPAEFVDLIHTEPLGLHIDPTSVIDAINNGEGEGNPEVTSSAILDKIREAVGDDGIANYRVESKDNGGFIAFSRVAVERPLDVNGDRFVAPIDALIVINQLNDSGAAPLSLWPSLAELQNDVNSDGFIAPIDALMIINYLNSTPSNAAAEGESPIFGEPLGSDRPLAVTSESNVSARTTAARETTVSANLTDSRTKHGPVAVETQPAARRRSSPLFEDRDPLATDSVCELLADESDFWSTALTKV